MEQYKLSLKDRYDVCIKTKDEELKNCISSIGITHPDANTWHDILRHPEKYLFATNDDDDIRDDFVSVCRNKKKYIDEYKGIYNIEGHNSIDGLPLTSDDLYDCEDKFTIHIGDLGIAEYDGIEKTIELPHYSELFNKLHNAKKRLVEVGRVFETLGMEVRYLPFTVRKEHKGGRDKNGYGYRGYQGHPAYVEELNIENYDILEYVDDVDYTGFLILFVYHNT